MAGNSAFQLVSERGWRRGLSSMLGSELDRWWKTRTWWVQSLIWSSVVGFLMSAIIFSSATPPAADEIAVLFAVFAGLFPAVGVVIIMQGTIVGEKKDGTAAWVLSKPISRAAFLLSKLLANSLGIMVTMVVIPGIIAYIIQVFTLQNPWTVTGFLAGLGVLFLSDFFFLSLTFMLGTIFSSRGPVIGIALGVLFLQQYLVGLLPFLRYMLTWNLTIPLSMPMDAVIPCLLTGSNNYAPITIVIIALESLLFIGIGLYRFSREEF